MNNTPLPLAVVVPAAGVGKRMKADCPKQYLKINDKTILQHTVEALLQHAQIEKVIIAISAGDEYFAETGLMNHPQVRVVKGGKERVDSVLAGLSALDNAKYPWVLVHDAARPCINKRDIEQLINRCLIKNTGGILAVPVRDTMKRGRLADINQKESTEFIKHTVQREQLWHALTPQMFPCQLLTSAIVKAQTEQAEITDEASAIEYIGETSLLVEGSSDNIKITRPDDLTMAEFILTKKRTQTCE